MKKSKVVRRYLQKVECPKCSHRFKTKQRTSWLTCHKCNRRFKRLENIARDENK